MYEDRSKCASERETRYKFEDFEFLLIDEEIRKRCVKNLNLVGMLTFIYTNFSRLKRKL